MFAWLVDVPLGSKEWTDKTFWCKPEWCKEMSTKNESIESILFICMHNVCFCSYTIDFPFQFVSLYHYMASLILLLWIRYICWNTKLNFRTKLDNSAQKSSAIFWKNHFEQWTRFNFIYANCSNFWRINKKIPEKGSRSYFFKLPSLISSLEKNASKTRPTWHRNFVGNK